MDENTALTIIVAVITLLLPAIWQIHQQNKELKKENERLNTAISNFKSENYEEYPRRDLNKIRELLSKARTEIHICGLVGYQPIHESNHEIVNLINESNGRVKILIANPDSDYFKSRTENESDNVGRLRNEHDLAIIELESIFNAIDDIYHSNLRVKLYDGMIEDVSFQIVDNKEMFVNEYNNGSRGYVSPMYKVANERLAHKIAFKHYSDLFESTWESKSSIELQFPRAPLPNLSIQPQLPATSRSRS